MSFSFHRLLPRSMSVMLITCLFVTSLLMSALGCQSKSKNSRSASAKDSARAAQTKPDDSRQQAVDVREFSQWTAQRVQWQQSKKTKSRLKLGDKLDLTPGDGRVVVLRLMTTWCPYCKKDLEQLVAHIRSGDWPSQKVRVVLVAYSNPRETNKTLKEFSRTAPNKFNFLPSQIEFFYTPKTRDELLSLVDSSGQQLITDWSGVPYGIIIDPWGKLVYRGQFTYSSQEAQEHYQKITELAAGNNMTN